VPRSASAVLTTAALDRPSGRRIQRTGPAALLVVVGIALGGCTSSGGDAVTASPGTTQDRIDTVQTDPPTRDRAVVVTYAEYSAADRRIDVSAFVQGVIESGGRCVVHATPTGGAPLTGPPSAAQDGATTTDCGALTLPVPARVTGSLAVSVTYSPATGADLSSPSTEVQIP